MPVTRIEDIGSKWLEPYRNLRTSNLTRFSGRFIAESRPLVERLLASELAVESVLIDERYLEEAVACIPLNVETFVVSSSLISELIGFHFHRGYLACGLRPDYRSPDDFLIPIADADSVPRKRWTGVMLVGVQDPENMGSILRTCAALGIAEIFLGPECVDPFARRVLRVSMGNAFKLRFFEVSEPLTVLGRFEEIGIETISACLSDDSEELSTFQRRGDSVLLLGNEARGLPKEIQTRTNRRLEIGMDLSTDSLNVSVAAGIILHNLCRIC
jgi:tRNA G18 (ribose-2'-O)-methylase SpoU